MPQDPTQPSAKIIADSISPAGHRLTTMEVVMHRFVLAEFNTHRQFSRNSASSRAIPVKKQLQRVKEDPALPVSWPSEKRGMQGGSELDGEALRKAQTLWECARERAVDEVEEYLELIYDVYEPDDREGLTLHKSLVNRLLEPFMWHTVVVSSTEWDNFWAQRCTEFSPLAQPEMRAAADAMLAAYRASTPVELGYGRWHLPYIQPGEDLADPRRISAARCARVSYLTHDGVRDPAEDEALFVRLASAAPMHASPFEHVATPNAGPVLGNFRGWSQFRHIVQGGA